MTTLTIILYRTPEIAVSLQRENLTPISGTSPLTINKVPFPEQKKPEPKLPPTIRVAHTDRVLEIEWGKRIGNGQCVSLAKSYGYNISGSARVWPEVAKRLGYRVDDEPEIGAVVVTTESSAGTNTGHVAIVEDIDDQWIYVVEQNYVSLTVSHGRIPIGNTIIRAYIHKS